MRLSPGTPFYLAAVFSILLAWSIIGSSQTGASCSQLSHRLLPDALPVSSPFGFQKNVSVQDYTGLCDLPFGNCTVITKKKGLS